MTKETYIGIRNVLAQIIKGTVWEGHVFLVGGCVRDDLMGTEIHDIDIAMNVPDGGMRFVKWLSENQFTAKGIPPIYFEHFGTAKVRLREYPDDEIDCVQTRKDKYVYEAHPHPKDNYGTIEQDATRRDLTINSLYVNVSTGELLDPTGQGQHDLKKHIIRTPNDPDVTFQDNAMHILRCIRFAVKYDWHIDDSLVESMKRNVGILEEARSRRIIKELMAIMALKERDRAFRLIKSIGATEYIAPFVSIARRLLQKEVPGGTANDTHRWKHRHGSHSKSKGKNKDRSKTRSSENRVKTSKRQSEKQKKTV